MTIRKFIAPLLLSLASFGVIVDAQVVNPSQPATGVPLAGTGITVAGQTVSVNYGVANSPFTGNLSVGGTLTAGTFAPVNVNATGNLSTNKTIAASSSTGALNYGTLTFADTNIWESWQTAINNYAQAVWQNSNAGTTASTNLIVANDQGTATAHFGEFGINSSGFAGAGSLNLPGATYLDSTTGDLVLGTTTSNPIHFVVNSGTTDAGSISTAGIATFNQISNLTGASARTMNAKFNDFVNITDFPGCDATGVTSSVSCFNAAYASGAKNFYYPPGTFLIDSPLTLPASSTHIGAGRYSTTIQANFTGGNIGLPVFTFAAGERSSVRDIKFNSAYTAAGVSLSTGYFAYIANNAFIGFKGYAVKLNNASSSLIANNETLYVSPMTGSEVGVLVGGGSANDVYHNRFAHRGIGIDTDTTNPSGGNIQGNDFEPLATGVRIQLNSGQWNIIYNYFEGDATTTETPMLVGTAGTGATLNGMSIVGNLLASAFQTTSVIDNVTNLTFGGNTVGPLVQFNSGVADMTEFGNQFVTAPTRNYARNVRTSLGSVIATGTLQMINANGQGTISEDPTNGMLLSSLNAAGAAYAPFDVDATQATLRIAGSSTQKYTLGATMSTPGPIYPGNPGGSVPQAITSLSAGTGVPSNANGNNGDFYFRGDTPGTTLQRIYVKSAGVWVGIL